MIRELLKKEDLKKFIAELMKKKKFYGPVRNKEGVLLSQLGSDEEMVLDYHNFKLPPKRRFFHQSEVILTYQDQGMTGVPLPEEETVLFGIRPCDALSFHYLDKVFIDERFIDPYYRRRRENSVIISLACSKPLKTCFCISMGGSPAGREMVDILAFDLKDSLLFEACSEKGGEFMESYSDLFHQVRQTDIDAGVKYAAEAEKRVPALNTTGITERLKGRSDTAIWDEMAQRCLGCGVCTYTCPTCHCFGLYDERYGLAGKRLRVQDSCMFPNFTLEASGHNPRTTKGNRMRQRIMHKLCYTVENFGDTFCVGCGRCIENCPVNMDMREVIAEAVK